MLEHLGYPAIATGSAPVAYSLGYDDGQLITLDAMLESVRRVAASVDLPVTADIEWGYAEQPKDVADNMRRVLDAGAVGINLEDSIREGEELFDVDFQCARIRAVREMADEEGSRMRESRASAWARPSGRYRNIEGSTTMAISDTFVTTTPARLACSYRASTLGASYTQ